MKVNKTITLLLFLLTGLLFHGHSQSVTLVVTTTDAVEHIYQLDAASQLYFNNGETLVIDYGSSSPATFPLSQIRKIVCADVTETEENAESRLQILPNPIQHQFIVRNLPERCHGRIYTLDGRLMKDFEATEGMMIDISELSSGMYLLSLNGQTLKLMKL